MLGFVRFRISSSIDSFLTYREGHEDCEIEIAEKSCCKRSGLERTLVNAFSWRINDLTLDLFLYWQILSSHARAACASVAPLFPWPRPWTLPLCTISLYTLPAGLSFEFRLLLECRSKRLSTAFDSVTVAVHLAWDGWVKIWSISSYVSSQNQLGCR